MKSRRYAQICNLSSQLLLSAKLHHFEKFSTIRYREQLLKFQTPKKSGRKTSFLNVSATFEMKKFLRPSAEKNLCTVPTHLSWPANLKLHLLEVRTKTPQNSTCNRIFFETGGFKIENGGFFYQRQLFQGLSIPKNSKKNVSKKIRFFFVPKMYFQNFNLVKIGDFGAGPQN